MSRPSVTTFVLASLFAAAATASAQPCTGLCTQQVTCPNGGTTSITGKVFAPNGSDPLPNVLVYVPNGPVQPFPSTVTCDVAGPLASGSPLVETSSNASGNFVLPNMPVGTNIPLVIQAGRWRRQITIPAVTACQTTPLSAASTRFPRNKTEGDIPQIAIVTGAADLTECVLRKIGIQDSEFTAPNGNGRIHLYYSQATTTSAGAVPTTGQFTAVGDSQLWSTSSVANKYAMTILACPADPYSPPAAQKGVFNNYLNSGGRVFATHYEYSRLYNISPFSSTAMWNPDQIPLDDQTATVNTSFTKGQQLSQWLSAVGAATTAHIPLFNIRHDQDGVIAPTQSWLSVNDPTYGNQSVQFTFNTPVGAPSQNQCGRVLFAEYHVEEPSTVGASTGVSFPQECTTGAMTPQEKLLEFALFDLSTFVAPDIPANVSASFVNPPEIFVQGDAAHTVVLNVRNVSPTIDTDQTLSVSVAIPNGLSLVSLAGAPATHWACNTNTATCSRTTGLTHLVTEPIAITLSVDSNAPVGNGPVILTATVAGGGLASNVVVSDPITIKGIAPITWPTPSSIVYGTALSGAQLNATSTIPGTFHYTPDIGALLNAGSQTLQVFFAPDDTVNYFPSVANVTLIVDKATPTITWSAPAPIGYGTAIGPQLNAAADVPGSFVYSPAAGAILNAGAQTLSAAFTPADQANYNDASAQVTLQVNKATPSITWGTPSAIVYGTALGGTQLNATTGVAGSFDYAPGAGAVLNAGSQALMVVFTPADTANYNGATANVTLQVDKATPTITWGTPASIVYGTALGGSQLNAGASVGGSFAYSPAAGAVLNAGSQPLTVVFTPADSANYNNASAGVTLAVAKATPTITWGTPASIVYGTALGGSQLNASASVGGSFAYSPAAGAVLNAGSQSLTVVFTPTDSANYNNANGGVTLAVGKATPTITWGTPASIVYGTALGGSQLNASASVGGSFAYSPAAGAVLNAGSQSLTAIFTPADSANYNNANAGVTLVVNKATPTITWNNPADIQYGTALSGAQLNATASVPGALVYTPAAGTVPPAGSNVLLVNFTPTDSVNYNTASRTVLLNVSAPPAQITGMPGIGCSIWPPNNKMVQVATISASGAASFSVTATSNEPAAAGDIVIGGTGLQPRTVQLRATRNGNGNGRVYTITATATNLAGIVTTQTAMCEVPHDSRQ